MRVLKWIGATFALLIIAGAGLWLWKPWVPSLELAEPGLNGRRVVEQGVFANYYPAAGPGLHAGILLLGGSEGGLHPVVGHQAIELQKAGYSVLQAAYFRAPTQLKNLELVPLETFDRAIDWLAKQPGVDKSRLAIVGWSKGAEAALLVATRRTDLRAVAAGAPSSVAWVGINWDYGGASSTSSWSVGGNAVSALSYGAYDWHTGILSLYQNGLRVLAKHPEAVIPIERSHAPLLLVCGEDDGLWPSCEMARQVEARAQTNGGPSVTVNTYKNAGHLAFGPPVARSNRNYERLAALGGTADGNAAARADGWPKVLEFLSAHLSPREGAPQ